jgi:membrane-associated protease RseP (regulator of RpoE activity)
MKGNSFSGMGLAPVDESLRAHLKLPKDQGLLVTSLDPHSPAAMAGIRQNDVLLKLGEAPLGKVDDLVEGLKKAAGDKEVSLSLLRGGSVQSILVQPRIQVTLGPVQPEPPTFFIGVQVGSIEPALRAQLQLPEKHGLLVIDVVKDSPAAKGGVRAHDILLKLDGAELTDQATLIKLVQAKGEKTFPLEIVREGKKQTIEVTPQRRKGFKVSFQPDQPEPRTFRFDVVHPGAVVPAPTDGAGNELLGTIFADVDADGRLDLYTATDSKEPRDNNAATAKRIDDLTAQVRQLRSDIEALIKAAREKK